jgi:hypothetical protein
VRAALAWTALLFALNLVWEIAQLPLYSLGPWAEWPAVAYAVLHCTAGDAGIALAAYLAAAMLTRRARWPSERPLAGLVVAWFVAASYTVWAEWQNVYVLRNWAYAAGMPTIAGIGVSPLLQWILLPALAVGWLSLSAGHRH